MKSRILLNISNYVKLTFILFIYIMKLNAEYSNETICKQIYTPLLIECMYDDDNNQNTFYSRNGTDNSIITNTSEYSLYTIDEYNVLLIKNLTKKDQGFGKYQAKKNATEVERDYNIYLYSKCL